MAVNFVSSLMMGCQKLQHTDSMFQSSLLYEHLGIQCAHFPKTQGFSYNVIVLEMFAVCVQRKETETPTFTNFPTYHMNQAIMLFHPSLNILAQFLTMLSVTELLP